MIKEQRKWGNLPDMYNLSIYNLHWCKGTICFIYVQLFSMFISFNWAWLQSSNYISIYSTQTAARCHLKLAVQVGQFVCSVLKSSLRLRKRKTITALFLCIPCLGEDWALVKPCHILKCLWRSQEPVVGSYLESVFHK